MQLYLDINKLKENKMDTVVVIRRPICHGQLWLQLFGDPDEEAEEKETGQNRSVDTDTNARDQIKHLSFT